MLFRSLTGEQQAHGNGTADPYVSISKDDRQIITVYVTDRGYRPDTFTIAPGRETWIYAIAQQNVSGCANFLVVPAFNAEPAVIRKGANWAGPLHNPQHDFVFTCSMGRLRATVHVKRS